MKKKKDLNFSYSELSWIVTAMVNLSGIINSTGLPVALTMNSVFLVQGKKSWIYFV